MSKKNKHRNAQFEKHKKQQRASRTTNLNRNDIPAPSKINTGDPSLDTALAERANVFKSTAEMRDELIRMKLAQAPRIPTAQDMGITPHDDYKVHAKVQIFVYDENDDTHFSMVKQVELPWNDGPVALGLQLATLTGEMAKEVWGLNNNGSDKSKPTKEN